jgi:group I intron endonuclease
MYIGQSNKLETRWLHHRKTLRKNKHFNEHLQNSFSFYGETNFDYKIIEECKEEELNDREVYWIDYFNTTNKQHGYNLTTGGKHFALSEQSIQKLKNTLIGKRLGENNGYSKISECQVLQIIELLLNEVSNNEISDMTGISLSVICKIRRKHAWTHLTQDITFNLKSSRSIKDDVREQVKLDILNGLKEKEILAKNNVSRSVYYRIKRHLKGGERNQEI